MNALVAKRQQSGAYVVPWLFFVIVGLNTQQSVTIGFGKAEKARGCDGWNQSSGSFSSLSG